MYVCICNGHRDTEIRQVAAAGFTSARDIYAHLGKPPRCGRCLELADKLVAEVHCGLANGNGSGSERA